MSLNCFSQTSTNNQSQNQVTSDTTRVKVGGSELIIIDKDLDKLDKLSHLDEDKGVNSKNKKKKFKGHWEGLELGSYMIADIDGNGKMDVYVTDKSKKIRWEYDGSKLIKQ